MKKQFTVTCPECEGAVEVTGGQGVGRWDGEDSAGKPVSGYVYQAKCPHCGCEFTIDDIASE